MSEPPPLANAEVGASCFKIKYSKRTAKSRKRWVSSFLWSLATVKIIGYLTKTSYARLLCLVARFMSFYYNSNGQKIISIFFRFYFCV